MVVTTLIPWLSAHLFAMLSSLSQAVLYGLVLTPFGVESRAVSPEVYPTPQGRGIGAWSDAYASAIRLVSQMTLEEKVNITRGYAGPNTCSGNTGSVPRLNWPGMCLQDAGNGVRAADFVSSYPSGIHAGASWDKNLTYRRGWYMGKEFRSKGVNVALGPNAGPLGRIPLGGRNWEGFSVDPYLSGALNRGAITGLQDAGVIANIKHFIANEQETYRRPYFGVEAASSNLDDKTLHEYYLWPFMDSVHAGVASAMCSYNRINNTYGCENSKLMNGVLKGELGFDGFITLDWNAQHTLNSANAGLDMLMPMGGNWGQNLTDAVRNGTVKEERVTDMAHRIIAAWYLTGQDKGFPVPGIGIQNLTQPHRQIEGRVRESMPTILEGAVAGHVLLKNKNRALPLKKPKMLSIFGYDSTNPDTKNVDTLFQLGYESSPEMALPQLGTEQHFHQAAMGGTIIFGGRAGSNAPAYMIDPLSALQYKARQDLTWVNWDITSPNPQVNAASDACLVFINAISTEGWDRDGLHDDASDGLVLAVASQCSNTIVIVHTVGVRLVDQWIDHPNITAVIVAHLPGQDSGIALQKLLYGEENFSGKLPYTMAKNESDYTPYKPCARKDNNDNDPQCDYAEGVYIDYRAFDRYNITPRAEFGFGLSYTTFEYADLAIQPLRDLTCYGLTPLYGDQSAASSMTSAAPSFEDLFTPVVRVHAKIKNTGHVSGAEVSQLYLSLPGSGGYRGSSGGNPGVPLKQLRGFEKTALKAGQTETVEFELTKRDLSIWDVVQQKWRVQGGEYTVLVGSSSRDIRLRGRFEVAEDESRPGTREDV